MILSIQSHVAYGHVGNRSAVFPLELLGFEVIPVNTVQFSNHTGYGAWRGQVFDADHIRDVIRGVDERGALRGIEAVLSGYMGSADTGNAILETVDMVRAKNPDALYCLDPVMGDYGRDFFVRPGIPEFIKNEALHRATIVTPNQFEAEYLAQMKIASLDDVKKAARVISAQGPRIVVVTSFMPDDTNKTISIFLYDNESDYIIRTDRLDLSPEPNGAGDLTAALFLGHYLKTNSAADALEKMTNSVFAVFNNTLREGSREIQLVASRFEIMQVPLRFKIEKV